MVFSSSICCLFLYIFIAVSFISPIHSFKTQNHKSINESFRSEQELQKLKETIATRLRQINKPGIKTFQHIDGDIIDCVLTHKQLAFDHPLLKGQEPMHFPSLREENQIGNMSDFESELWSMSGESCPEGTIPVRRVTEQDLLRASSIDSFGRKFPRQHPHEHARVFVNNHQFFGARAQFNLWRPRTEIHDFSSSQMSISSGSEGKDVNVIEAGWHVYPQHNGDDRHRFFIYWTADAYKSTGCYNLACPGFIQLDRSIIIGGGFPDTSSYNGSQFEITIKIVKHEYTGNWLLLYGNGRLAGYWPAALFNHLKYAGDEVHFGGQIKDGTSLYANHTSTEMGSGHFAEEGFGKAAYIKSMQVVDHELNLNPLSKPRYYASRPYCYNIKGGTASNWGNYIYFGGPGRNKYCV